MKSTKYGIAEQKWNKMWENIWFFSGVGTTLNVEKLIIDSIRKPVRNKINMTISVRDNLDND